MVFMDLLVKGAGCPLFSPKSRNEMNAVDYVSITKSLQLTMLWTFSFFQAFATGKNVHFSYSCGIRKKDVQCVAYNVFRREWM